MRLSKPLLPAEYVQRVLSDDAMRDFQSSVFESDAHQFRVEMRSWIKPKSADSPFAYRDGSAGFTAEARRTYLHLYASEGDVLALSELITCGATPSLADNAGETPLHLVGHGMALVKDPNITVLKADGSGFTDKRRLYARLAWVLRILVEQHANVSIMIGDYSLLDLLCGWKDWEIISLLLKHRAMPSPASTSRFTSSTDRKRFLDLVKKFEGSPRPARICPCWSGKTVPECHGKSPLPYPLEYMCVCGSSKTYACCCHKRGKFVSELWDNATQRNLLRYDKLPVQSLPPTVRQNVAAEILEKCVIDPAFAYAMGKTEFIPMPHGRSSSRAMRQDMQTIWNNHIDDYIAQGSDPRSREEIERAAKVSSGNGALFRVCEGNQCTNIEGSEVKFNVCSKCKTTVYCSRACQKSSWRAHRVVCGSEEVEEQALPSQVSIKGYRQEALVKLAQLSTLADFIRSQIPPS